MAEKKQKKPAAKKTAAGKKTKAKKSTIPKTKAKTKIVKNGKRVEAPYPHFRYYKKSKHPALIVGEQKSKKKNNEEYKYRKVMHKDRDGRHLNEKVDPNPNPKDKKPMYIAKRIRSDEKDNFENQPLPWKYPKNDKKK